MDINPYFELFQKQKTHHPKVRLADHGARIQKLKRLRQAIFDLQPEIQKGVYLDFRKHPAEVDLTEIFVVISEINHTIRHLKKWMRPSGVSTPMALFGTRSQVFYEPKGVTLIIAPWNYPFQLLVGPLVAAIAAGNCAIVKPSEFTPHTAAAVRKLIAAVFKEDEVAMVEGAADATQKLLELPFDHILFTGSTKVGKIVMAAAAKNLTSVTLELGGKSPALIDSSAQMKTTANRVIWGKFVNAGQTCIAPDYVLIAENRLAEFITEAKVVISKFYGANTETRDKTPELCRIINPTHFHRLKGLIEDSQRRGANIEVGAVYKAEENYIAPTLISNVTLDSKIMEEEIFGPILPILTYKSLDQAISIINGKDKPLALYIFSQDQSNINHILTHTTAGGTCVNNTLIHLGNPNLPFGGVGPSGLGSYHGLYGFKAFSHERAVMRQSWLDMMKQFYPPYTPWVKRMIQFVVKHLA